MGDRTKLLQAAQEFAYTFVAFFALSLLLWIGGWEVVPDPEAWRSALNAALLAGATGAAKAVMWYFTGTVAVPLDYVGDEEVHPETD